MKFRRQLREEVSVNLTPLIDVVFLLLIFFMVSTTFTRESRLQVELPEAEVAAPAQEEPLELVIGAQGQYHLAGKTLTDNSIEALRQALSAFRQHSDQPLLLVADANAPHRSVVRAMDVAGQLGFQKLHIATQETASSDEL